MAHGFWLATLFAVRRAILLAAPIVSGVSVRLDPGPYVIGQAVALRVEGPAYSPDGTPAQIAPPNLGGADLIAVANTSGGGPTRFWLVPRRAGPLVVPPFRAVAAGWATASRPVPIVVAPVPPSGRPASFGGGIGSFHLDSRLAGSEIRPGQPVDFALRVTGPAALGGTGAPDLGSWVNRPGAVEARLVANDLVPTDPPTRTFHYELRTRAIGRWTLPPVLLASFDPVSGRYLTQTTRSLGLMVTSPAAFHPDQIRHSSSANPAPATGQQARVGLVVGAALIASGLAWWGWLGRGGDHGWIWSVGWRREVRRLGRLDPRAPDWPNQVATRLERLLARALRRPLAALTPPEAAAALADLTGDPLLVDRARELVADLDRLRFEPGAADSTPLRRAGQAKLRLLIEAIGARGTGPKSRLGRSPSATDG